ncbi:uncharacterized protein LOC131163806 [Malania oleifera]|uniref:uncharacterized protein LOC131163806 n=1 Tax=Malania oleifera TaxID=397392 RepID=UPI0025AE89E6|nr:uncharacterized protein LOC131163806 [Malania oleifera]
MDSFDFDIVKAEKADAMLRYRVFGNLAKVFRVGEVCVVLLFLFWISPRVPSAVKISGEYLRQLSAVAVSPSFIFLLGNAIIVVLLAKSGQFSAQNSAGISAGTVICEEFLSSANGGKIGSESPPLSHEPEEIMYEDKQIISQRNEDSSGTGSIFAVKKVYQRTQSEKLKSCSENQSGVLRRSETEIYLKTVGQTDHLSNEEFRRTVEAFIAKQLKFHRQESVSIVPLNHS